MDTLDTNPYNIHMMRPSPAHTRTRTLQGRLGTHQERTTLNFLKSKLCPFKSLISEADFSSINRKIFSCQLLVSSSVEVVGKGKCNGVTGGETSESDRELALDFFFSRFFLTFRFINEAPARSPEFASCTSVLLVIDTGLAIGSQSVKPEIATGPLP